MTIFRLILRGLFHHRRMHATVAAGVAVAVAAIVGALVVGDCVRGTLRQTLLGRLGGVQAAMETGPRCVRADLADEVARSIGEPTAAAVELAGAAVRAEVRANRVMVYGLDERGWQLLGYPGRPPGAGDVVINEPLARKLGVRAGQELQLLLPPLAAIGAETPLPGQGPETLRPYVRVAAVEPGADFSLRAQQGKPLTAFVSRAWLAGRLEQTGRANLILTASPDARAAGEALRATLRPADLQLTIRPVPGAPDTEVRSDAVFLPPPVTQALAAGGLNGRGAMAHFLNRLVADDRSSPYAVAAGLPPGTGPVPADLKDDEFVPNTWLADDLALTPGQAVSFEYFVPGPGGGLETRRRSLRVRLPAVPVESPGADRSLMPDYPGLKDIEDCRRWRSGASLTEPVRAKDQQYWRDHKGSPKAYVTLASARAMWGNRFGDLTAYRLPATDAEARVTQALRTHLPAEAMGLAFRAVGDENAHAAGQGTDFSQLFLALSFFLIGSAVLVLAMLFSLGVSQRASEGGILLAMGFSPRQVRRVLLGEAGVTALVGALVGVGLGLLYTKGLLLALARLWADAAPGAAIGFHVEPASLLNGAAGGLVTALAAMRLSLHWRRRLPVRQQLAGEDVADAPGSAAGAGHKTAFRLAVAITILWEFVAWAAPVGGKELHFFVTGAMLLLVGVTGAGVVIHSATHGAALSLAALARRNAARRMRRSLSVVGALACGSFIVVAVGASRVSTPGGPPAMRSGQGGFALYAETAVPVVKLPAAEALPLVPMRLRPGDSADCFNLARTQRPRILGVNPQALAGRFDFVRAIRPGPEWLLLDDDLGPDVLPAIGDEPTVTWGLGLTGDKTLAVVDEAGRTRRVKIVAVLAGSVLQGNLIVSERQFTRAWPGLAGYSVFLAEATDELKAAQGLRQSLQDYGLDVESASARMAAFHSVENTYLSIFGVLGALGLALGSAAVAVLAAHNVNARRGELAILRAVGFSHAAVRRLVLREHVLLVVLGLAVGILAGAVAVIPAVAATSRPVALLPLAITLAGMAVVALVSVRVATGLALRGQVMVALRND